MSGRRGGNKCGRGEFRRLSSAFFTAFGSRDCEEGHMGCPLTQGSVIYLDYVRQKVGWGWEAKITVLRQQHTHTSSLVLPGAMKLLPDLHQYD